MKPKFRAFRRSHRIPGVCLAATVVIPFLGIASAQTAVTWNGSASGEWNHGPNWDGGVVPNKGVNNTHAVINTTTPNIATITVGIIPPVDIIIGSGAGNTGRLDHPSGDATTGSGNWLYVGTAGGTGIYNLANTAEAGPGISGYAMGSGSMNTNGGRLYVGGWTSGGSNGTLNINTMGTLSVGSELNISANGGVGVVNLENGSVISNDWTRVGGGAGSQGTLHMTGGSITKNGNNHFVVGGTGSTGVANVSGGSINVNNEFWIANAAGSTGTLNFSGGSITNNSWVAIGRDGATKGTLNFTNGTWNKTGGGNFIVGDNSPGEMNMNGASAVLDVNGEFWVGQAGNGNGLLNFDAGSITNSSWVAIARGGNGVVNMTGGTWAKNGTGSNFIVGSSGSGRVGTMNMSGGSVTVQPSTTADRGITWVGELNGVTGNLNLSGTAAFTTSRMVLGVNSGATGNLNLNGGTLYTGRITGGAGVANVTFNGGQVVATAASDVFLENLDSAQISAGGFLLDDGDYNLTIPQTLGGTGGIVKEGYGTLTLSAANTYTGTTHVHGGRLAITTDSLASGAVVLEDLTEWSIRQSAADQSTTVASASFGNGSETLLDFNLGAFPGNTANAPLQISGSATVQGAVMVHVRDEAPALGSVPLVSYGSRLGAGQFVLGSLPDGVQGHLTDNLAGSVSLTYTRINAPYWTGAASAVWDTAASNWFDDYSETATVFAHGDPVRFDDRVGEGPTAVTLNSIVNPGGSGVTFANETLNYSLSGSGRITGNNGLTKSGAGTAAIQTANDYTGPTVIAGGVLQVPSLANGGLPSPIGASSNSEENLVLAGGTLHYTGTATTTDRGFMTRNAGGGIRNDADLTITGPAYSTGGGFVKTGEGNLFLTYDGLNTFGGGGAATGVDVRQGTLTLRDPEGYQSNLVSGSFYVGSTPNAPAHLVLDGVGLNVGSWIGLGRGNGDADVLSTLTATDSTIVCTNLTVGWNNNLPNNSRQSISLMNSSWVNNGMGLIAESANSRTEILLAGTSSYTSPGRFQMAINGQAQAHLTLRDSASMTLTGEWFSIGNDGTATFTVRDNASFTKNGGDFNIGDVGTAHGTLNIQDSATVSTGNIVFVGKNGGTTGIVNMSGGTFNSVTYITIGRRTGATGLFHMSGGVLNQTDPNAGLIVGENGTGTLTMDGGEMNIAGGGLYLTAETVGTGNATLNLNGGTITARRVVERDFHPGNISTLRWNGGLLRAGDGAFLDFMGNLDTASVLVGGAHVDTNGQTIAIAQPLQDGDGLGGGLTKTGEGFLQLNGINSYTGTTLVSAGSLGGTGTLAGPLVVSATANLAPGASVGTFTAGQTTLSGTYLCEVDGSNADRLVVQGDLDISGATLTVSANAPAAGPWVIATYSGSLTGSFASVSAGWAVDTTTPGEIRLVQDGSPYDAWAAANITAIDPSADAGPDADPDGDGLSNLAEYALNGNPLSSAASGKVVGKLATVNEARALVLTLPVRSGASFSGATAQVSAPIDGVIYTIQGGLDLSAWNLSVSEVLGADKASIEAGLPGLGGDWEYRTFRAPGPVSGETREFLRAVITRP